MYDPFYSQREAVKRWRRNNPDRVREIQRKYRNNSDKRKTYEKAYQAEYQKIYKDQWPEKYLFQKSKTGAAQRGIEFGLSLEDIIIPETCPLLNILIFYDPGEGYNPNAPSLDRIDNSKGYIPGNVWVISTKANTMKSNSTLEELKTFATNVLEHFQQEEG